MLRVAAAVMTLLALSGEDATAAVMRHVSCSVVRFYVAKYSAAAAEGWARSRGATDAEISIARKCLSTSVHVSTRSADARL